MSDPQTKSQTQLAIVVGIIALAANGLFFFLSNAYWADRVKRFGEAEMAGLGPSRIHFAIFSASIAAAAIAAIFAPRIVGMAVAALTSLAAFAGAYGAFSRDLPLVVAFAALIVGAAIPALLWLASQRSRAGWAALASSLGVLAAVMLFAAPRIRALLGGGLWTAMIIPGVLTIGTIALVLIRRDYGSRAT
jgi:hypothetical protein